MAKPKELPVPPGIKGDAAAAEVVRAWIAHGELQCVVAPKIWDDPAPWGLLLADLARQVAQALHEHGGKDPEETLERILDAFDEAMDEDAEDA